MANHTKPFKISLLPVDSCSLSVNNFAMFTLLQQIYNTQIVNFSSNNFDVVQAKLFAVTTVCCMSYLNVEFCGCVLSNTAQIHQIALGLEMKLSYKHMIMNGMNGLTFKKTQLFKIIRSFV